jgi:hypothetical protein
MDHSIFFDKGCDKSVVERSPRTVDLACEGCGETYACAVDNSAWRKAEGEFFEFVDSLPVAFHDPLRDIARVVAEDPKDLISVRYEKRVTGETPDFVLFLEPSPLFPELMKALRIRAAELVGSSELIGEGLLAHSNVSIAGGVAIPTIETAGDGVESSPATSSTPPNTTESA